MVDRFAASFRVMPGCPAGEPWQEPRLVAATGYRQLAARFAGCSFDGGLYRLHDAGSGPTALGLIAEAFPDFAQRACPFGYDWLGRQFALDARRTEAGAPLVLLLEPGTGAALEIPLTISSFHEQLGDLREPALAAGFFEQWASANPGSVPLRSTNCVGYKIPLFLGGSDTLDNLEVIDLEVYWSLCGQLRAGTLELPAGASIRRISTSD